MIFVIVALADGEMLQHECYQSFVLAYIYDTLYRGFTINVKELCRRFQYTESSMYKITRVINDNLLVLDSPYKVEKVTTSMYSFTGVNHVSLTMI